MKLTPQQLLGLFALSLSLLSGCDNEEQNQGGAEAGAMAGMEAGTMTGGTMTGGTMTGGTMTGGAMTGGTMTGGTMTGGTMTGGTTMGGEPVEEDVSCEALPAAPEGECVFTSAPSGSAQTLLIQADILGQSGLIEQGSALMELGSPNGELLCVGCDCEAQVDDNTARLVCPSFVLSPGLINPHDHLGWALNDPASPGDERYDHRHDWRKGKRQHNSISAGPSNNGREAVLYGELRMLMGASTSIAGSTSTDDLLRNLDDSGRNGGLGNFEADYRTFPLGDSSGTLAANGCDAYRIDNESRLNSAIYLPHVSEGIDPEARNEFACLSGAAGVDLIASNTSIIHGIGLTPSDIVSVAQDGASLVWSPRSNVQLYGHTAPVVSYAHAGVNISLGTDWVPSGSMNMLRELRCADLLNHSYYGSFFSDRQVWQMATRNAAVALGVGTQIGVVARGYVADLALFRREGRSPYRAVLEAEPADVALVTRGGEVLYGDSAIVDELRTSCDRLDVCGVSKSVCLSGDTGLSLANLQSSTGGAYPLFFCDAEPNNEPSCVPFREGEFNGMSLPDDQDGDGVLDADDNCPTVFNAPRPLEGNTQGDADNDGLGDACDVCPLNEGSDCVRFDPNDRDADGVEDSADNCQGLSNPDQLDTDADMIGDACDACPESSNLNGAGCPSSIYAVKRAEAPAGNISVEGVVTAVESRGFFMQVPADHSNFEGVDFSALYVYLGNGDLTPPSVGQLVKASGEAGDFYGQKQLSNITAIEALAEGVALPTHELVSAADVATEGPRAAALEGALVALEGVTVTALEPEPGAGDSAPTNEFVLDNALRVNDLLYLVNPLPAVGDSLTRIQGVLRFANENSKLEPTGAEDVSFEAMGPPTSLSFDPSELSVSVGATTSFTLRLDNPAEMPMTVTLNSSDASVASLPASVEIAVGARGVSVELEALTVGETTLTATADDLTASASLTVVDVITADGVVINEVDYDQPGSDTAEFIELYNASSAPVDLSVIRLEIINGNNNSVADSFELSSVAPSLSAGQFLVLANAGVSVAAGALSAEVPLNFIQNGSPDGVRLVHTETGEVIDAVSYEGDVALALEGEGLSLDASDRGDVEGSIARCVDGADTNNNAADFAFTSTLTPGASNQCN